MLLPFFVTDSGQIPCDSPKDVTLSRLSSASSPLCQQRANIGNVSFEMESANIKRHVFSDHFGASEESLDNLYRAILSPVTSYFNCLG